MLRRLGAEGPRGCSGGDVGGGRRRALRWAGSASSPARVGRAAWATSGAAPPLLPRHRPTRTDGAAPPAAARRADARGRRGPGDRPRDEGQRGARRDPRHTVAMEDPRRRGLRGSLTVLCSILRRLVPLSAPPPPSARPSGGGGASPGDPAVPSPAAGDGAKAARSRARFREMTVAVLALIKVNLGRLAKSRVNPSAVGLDVSALDASARAAARVGAVAQFGPRGGASALADLRRTLEEVVGVSAPARAGARFPIRCGGRPSRPSTPDLSSHDDRRQDGAPERLVARVWNDVEHNSTPHARRVKCALFRLLMHISASSPILPSPGRGGNYPVRRLDGKGP